jgi:hypothetical protein
MTRNQTLQFTNFGMLFNAVAMNCTISNFLKILSTMQSVHYKDEPISKIADYWGRLFGADYQNQN